MFCRSFLLLAVATVLFGAVANAETPAPQPTSVTDSRSQAAPPQAFRRTCGNRIVSIEPSAATSDHSRLAER
jgi:hypothetical protein